MCEGKGGNPPAYISWYKDGVQIVEQGKDEKSLTLSHVNIKDSGSYKCLARSHNLTDEKSIEILVYCKCMKLILNVCIQQSLLA